VRDGRTNLNKAFNQSNWPSGRHGRLATEQPSKFRPWLAAWI